MDRAFRAQGNGQTHGTLSHQYDTLPTNSHSQSTPFLPNDGVLGARRDASTGLENALKTEGDLYIPKDWPLAPRLLKEKTKNTYFSMLCDVFVTLLPCIFLGR